MTRRRRYHGAVQLRWPLPVQGDALGLEQTVMIGPYKVTVALPDGEGEFPQSHLLVDPGRSHPAGPLRADMGAITQWGFQHTKEIYNVGALRLSVLLGETDGISDLTLAIRPWLDVVQLWAESWLKSVVDVGNRPNGPEVLIATGRAPMATTSLRPTVIVARRQGLSEAQVRGAFRRASSDELPPAAHTLLTSARRAIFAGDMRRAVIESGTAMEVAMSGFVRRHLASLSVPDAFIDAATINANGAVGLHQLCKTLGWQETISANKLKNVTGVRNRAAHGGQTPDEAQARTALHEADAAVEALSPLALS